MNKMMLAAIVIFALVILGVGALWLSARGMVSKTTDMIDEAGAFGKKIDRRPVLRGSPFEIPGLHEGHLRTDANSVRHQLSPGLPQDPGVLRGGAVVGNREWGGILAKAEMSAAGRRNDAVPFPFIGGPETLLGTMRRRSPGDGRGWGNRPVLRRVVFSPDRRPGLTRFAPSGDNS